jgi:hypothetical protein
LLCRADFSAAVAEANGRLQCAPAHLNQGEPAMRLRAQRRCAGGPGKIEHGIRVERGALQVTLAMKLSLEGRAGRAGFRRSSRHWQSGACLLDRLRVVAGPGQIADAFLDRGRSIRPRRLWPEPRCLLSLRIRHQLHEVSIRCEGDLPARAAGPECGAANAILSYRRPAQSVTSRPITAGRRRRLRRNDHQTSPRSDSSALTYV